MKHPEPFPIPERELRYTAAPITLRESPADDEEEDEQNAARTAQDKPAAAPLVRGYAALFDTPSEDLGGFVEQIARGAFAGVDLGGVVALFNHDPNLILARSGGAEGREGTLRLGTDERGLWYEFTPPDSPNGQNFVEALRRGDIVQSSFGFTIESEGGEDWVYLDEEEAAGGVRARRTITKIARLYDVSPVTYPAYPDTTVALRSLEAARQKRAQGATPAPSSTPPALSAAQRARLRLQSQ